MVYSPTSVIAVSAALPALALFTTILRFYARLRLSATYLGIDDWLALAAVIFSLADGANLIAAAVKGDQGRVYDIEIPHDRAVFEGKSDYAQVLIEKPMYCFIKLSVLFFFRRFFHVHKRFRVFSLFMIVVIVLWGLAFFLAEAFQCGVSIPSPLWTPGASRSDCVNANDLNLVFAVTDAVTDVIVLAMPYPYLRKLQMGKRERAGLIAIFALGTLAVAASFIRLGFIAKAFTENYAGGGNNKSSGTPPALWSTVEGAIGVIAACLPPLGPLIRKAPNARKASVSLYYRYVSSRKKSTTDMADSNRKPSFVSVPWTRKKSKGDIVEQAPAQVPDVEATAPDRDGL